MHHIKYNITSKLTLAQYLKRNKLRRDEFIDIFFDITKIILDARDYLLFDKSFILEKEYIYLDPNSKEISMVYLPLNFELDVNDALKNFTINFIMFGANIEETRGDNFLARVLGILKTDTFNILQFNHLLKELKMGGGMQKQYINAQPFDNVSLPNQHSSSEVKFKGEDEVDINAKALKPQISKPQIPMSKTPETRIEKPSIPTPKVSKLQVSQRTELKKNKKSWPIPGIQMPNKTEDPLNLKAKDNAKFKVKYKTSTIVIGAALQSLIIAISIILLISGIMDSLGNDTAVNIFAVTLLAAAGSFLLWKNILVEKNKIEIPVEHSTNPEPKRLSNSTKEQKGAPLPAMTSAPSINKTKSGGTKNPIPRFGPHNPIDKTVILCADGSENFGRKRNIYPYLDGKNNGILERIEINKPSFIVGRLRGNADYISKNNAVGKVHAEIISRDNRYFLKDLNSRNGTFVNDKRLTGSLEYELKDGDVVVFANSRYMFVVP